LLAGSAGLTLDRSEGGNGMAAFADEVVTTSDNLAPEILAPQPKLPEPRDPEIAVREQYDAALAAGTVAALELFIQRYPDHRLAVAAREEIRRLKVGGKGR
jgi:hypothetical protein